MHKRPNWAGIGSELKRVLLFTLRLLCIVIGSGFIVIGVVFGVMILTRPEHLTAPFTDAVKGSSGMIIAGTIALYLGINKTIWKSSKPTG